MKKRSIFFLFLISYLFCACSNKNQEETLKNLRHQALFYTQKNKILEKDLNAVLIMTYINPVLEEYEKDEIFVLSLAPKEFEIHSFDIYMGSEKAKIEPIQENNELLKYFITNTHAKYFKASFSNKDLQTLKTKICINSQCFELNFQKYSKSLYYRSEDVDTQYN
ncbi:hypothetical protein DMB92_01805 [Campylobacter sp. MIT 99-7217]|uniref:hypothetical protein n=1 Tax=Campylobacter sp. MIT 99-7217 TaxID=535091 RepID=UPI00115A898C|nr:hypothetical protein [Campylobacter sp. MIT 99-7217]TQR34718.1 hypothetical protein DMB92_01805 [Campylobacter sp. MIT 99-7217]